MDIQKTQAAVTTTKIKQDLNKLDPQVCLLDTNKNRAHQVWQRTRFPTDKETMTRAQRSLKNYLTSRVMRVYQIVHWISLVNHNIILIS